MATNAPSNPNSPLVSVERQFETDIATGRTEVRMFVKMYFDARDSGLLADIGDRRWRTLCCLATYMDQHGVCNPSQARIARDLGIHRQRVNERIRELLQYRFSGRPVIQLEKRRVKTASGGRWASNVYQILPIANLRIFDQKRAPAAPLSGNPDSGPESADPDIGHRPMSGKPDTGNPDTNKNQSSNENTHGVREGDEASHLVCAFHGRNGSPARRPLPKEVSQAAALLQKHGADTAHYIVDYAVVAAQRTRFEMRHFGAVLSYVDEALEALHAQTQRRIREEHRRRRVTADASRTDFEAWRAAEVDRIQRELPKDTLLNLRRSVSEAILAKTKGKVPPGYETLLRIELMREIAATHDLPTFEEWSAATSNNLDHTAAADPAVNRAGRRA